MKSLAFKKVHHSYKVKVLAFFATKKWYLMAFAVLIPAVLQQTLSALVNLIDNLMVGQLSTEFIDEIEPMNSRIKTVFKAINMWDNSAWWAEKPGLKYFEKMQYSAGQLAVTGVAASNQIFIIIFAFMGGFINAISVFGAQFFGAGRYGLLRQTLAIRIIIGFFAGVIVIILSYTVGYELIAYTTNPNSTYKSFYELVQNNKLKLDQNQIDVLKSHLNFSQTTFNTADFVAFFQKNAQSESQKEQLVRAILRYYEYRTVEISTIKGVQYNKLVVLSYPILGVICAFIASFHETKRGKIPLILTFVAVITNLFLNALLINGIALIGVKGIGIPGAAIATLLARILQLVLIIVIICWKKYEFNPHFKDFFKFRIDLLKRMLSKSWPIILNDFLFALASTFALSLITRWSYEAFSAAAVAATINSIFYTLYIGFGVATAVLIAGELGSDNLVSARYNGKHLIRLGFFSSLLFSLLLVASSFFLPQLLYPSVTKEAVRIVNWMLRFDALVFSAYTIMYVCIYAFRAGGKTMTVLVFDSILTWSFTILVLFLQIKFASYDITTIYLITRLTEIIKMFICLYIYNKGKWLQNLAGEKKVYPEKIPKITFARKPKDGDKIDIANF